MAKASLSRNSVSDEEDADMYPVPTTEDFGV
jgi:hypothetical protein